MFGEDATFTFISHSVQIKRDASGGYKWIVRDFISHSVQIKLFQIDSLQEFNRPLYPTPFR